MKILYYDCFSGISGDMHLGAMIDLGVDPDGLIEQLGKLDLSGYELRITKDQRKGISGTKVDVILDGDHNHQNHGHHHAHDHDHQHPHRNLKDISEIIRTSELSHALNCSPIL